MRTTYFDPSRDLIIVGSRIQGRNGHHRLSLEVDTASAATVIAPYASGPLPCVAEVRRGGYAGGVSKTAEVLRVLERYLVEVVERHALCPWARTAREDGELAVAILWGTPAIEAWVDEARRLLVMPATRVALVVAPELDVSRPAFAGLRDRVAAQIPEAGIAEFHPAAVLDLATPARLVPFLRRSPDPLLQLVPLRLIDAVRAVSLSPGLSQQAAMLGGMGPAAPRDVATRIASANFATVTQAHSVITTTLDDIAADRHTAYVRVGIG